MSYCFFFCIATSAIQVCYKNCWKIRAYFDDEEKKKTKQDVVMEMPLEQEAPSFSGILSSTNKDDSLKVGCRLGSLNCPLQVKSPCGDISNLPKETPASNIFKETISSSIFKETATPSLSSTLPSSGVWGSHLNIQPVVSKPQALSSFALLSTKLSLQASSSNTRKSLKKKPKRASSFFDTLGDSQDSCSFLNTPPSSSSLPLTSAPAAPHPTLPSKPRHPSGSGEEASLELFPELSTRSGF